MKRAPISPVMAGMLADFNRAPVKCRGEYSDGAGHVLISSVNHYDQRRFGALVSRGLVDWFKRCACEHPCSCNHNGWHITAAGIATLAAK